MKKNLKWLVMALVSVMILSISYGVFAQDSEEDDPSGGVGIGFVNKVSDSSDKPKESSTSTDDVTSPVNTEDSSSSSTSTTSDSRTSSNTSGKDDNNKPNDNQGGSAPNNKGMIKYLPQTGEGRRNFALVGVGIIVLVIVLVIVYYKNKNKGEKK